MPARIVQSYAERPLAVVVVLATLALFVMSLPNLADPLVRFDDYPALLAEPEGFYWKTLYEGRWLNYWWHLRGVVTPAWLNFAVYQFFWAIFAAALATLAMGRAAPFFQTLSLAVLILVAPPALLIAPWFNTLLPGLGLVALFAVMACRLSPRALRLWLVVFVPLTLMAYTTYPLLLLALCLVQPMPRRGLTDLARLMAVFVGSFALGIVLIYGLNHLEHGIFGIPMAEWRDPTPAHDLASALANLPLVVESFSEFAHKVGFGFLPATFVHAGLLVGATFVVARRTPWLALYLWTGLGSGIGLLVLQVVTTGVIVPARAMAFIWVFYAILLARAAFALSAMGPTRARMVRNGVVFIAASYALQTAIQYAQARDWQAETRALAEASGPGSAPILLLGDHSALASADKAGIQDIMGLVYRLRYLTGHEVRVCDPAVAACQAAASDNALQPVVIRTDTATVIHMPRLRHLVEGPAGD